MSWSIQDLVQATKGVLGGQLIGDEGVYFDSVSTDTRTLTAGSLYIAIKGENFDGHEFIGEAVKQGAVVVLVSEPVESIVPSVLVEDTRIALGLFASWHRQQMPLKKLIAVTGSNGKTTCKNMIQHLLSKKANVLATQGNLNNDLGVPRTLLDISEQHEYAVIEMGANHVLEIDYLSRMAQPDIAVITLAAGAHLEGFGSLEGVIKTKGEILVGLTEGKGVAVLNQDSPGFEYWTSACEQKSLKVVSFGQTGSADIHYQNFQQTFESVKFELLTNSLKFSGEALHAVTMPMLGEHNAMNACAALTVTVLCGFTLNEMIPCLADFYGVSGRLQKKNLPSGILIDDTYNANPDSMKAALHTVASLPGTSIACLGAMAELGQAALEGHESVAAYAKAQGIVYLLVYGEAAKSMVPVFGEGSFWFDSHQTLAEKAIELMTEHSINHCLVKGSRSTKMETVTDLILKHFTQ